MEKAAQQIGLHINEDKTKYISFNQPEIDLNTLSGNTLEQVDDFQYLGAWMDSKKKDMDVRIAKGWVALNKLKDVWKSKLHRDLKIRFFRVTVESILMYGAESWTLTETLEKRLDVVYTRMLRAALDIPWSKHITNIELYGRLGKLSTTLMNRRLRFIGHIWRKKDEIAHKFLLWEPVHGSRKVGRPRYTYVDQLRDDTGLEKHQLMEKMGDRKEWRSHVNYVRACST